MCQGGHMILVSAQVLLVLTLALWTLGLRTRACQATGTETLLEIELKMIIEI